MIQLFLVQLFGHLVGDFYLQGECMCASKREKGWRSPWLYAHMAIVFLVAWCVSWSLGFWWGALLIAVLHGLTDGIKASLQKRGCSAHALFWGDQVVHVVVIALVVWLYSSYCGWMEWEWLSGYRAAMILGLTFCLWPANFFIGDFLTMIKVEKSRSEVAAQKAILDASRPSSSPCSSSGSTNNTSLRNSNRTTSSPIFTTLISCCSTSNNSTYSRCN